MNTKYLVSRSIKPVAVLVCLTALFACSNKGWYEVAQQYQSQKCQQLPSGAEYEDCQRWIAPDYEVYESERKRLIDN